MSLYEALLLAVWAVVLTYCAVGIPAHRACKRLRADLREARADRDHWRARCHDHEWERDMERVPGIGVRR